ncbi:MAG: alpha-amylase family glycosyl hydrolase [Pseudomonadales bacterium]
MQLRVIDTSHHISPSSQTGMGAIPYNGGTAFRVWAPNAERVSVAGVFNTWSSSATPLANEGNGYWSGDVAGAEPGDQYKFVVFRDSQALWRNDPYAKDVTSSVGNSVIQAANFDWGLSRFVMPPWNELVIYELHIGTFNDQPGGPPGNLDRAIQRLPYLRDLGINTIQVMPPMEFAGGFSWGYNPAHLFAIEEDYGGPRALKKLIKTAHELGIAVIFDVVYNHLGPSDLDLWQFDGWSENGKGGIYFYNDWRSTTPWGDTRPDYSRGEVRQYLRDNALMWLEEYQADGLRWDATAYIRNVHGNNNDPAHDIPEGWGLLRWIHREINIRQPWKISIAEDLRDNAWITKEFGAGGAGFDAQWDSHFVHPIREAIIAPDDHARNMYAVRDAIYHRYNPDAFERIIYTESHDEVANGKARVPEEIWHGNAASWYAKKRSTLGAALVFTAPGIPMIFQGQEFLEDEWFHDQDPIDWSKQQTYRGIWQMYRDLIRLRRNWYDNARGLRGQHVHVHHVNNNDKVIAFHRWAHSGPGDSVVVVMNMANRGYSSYKIGFPRTGLWKVRFNSDWNGYDTAFGNHSSDDTIADSEPQDTMPFSGNIGIGPYSALILSQDA